MRRAKNRPIDLDHRLDVGKRLRSMYLSLGMQRTDAAKFLQVSERTLHNWESGRHVIPFAVYKLLRLLNGMDLPGATWEGWRFSGGKLYTPEGYGFTGKDGSWWSLLVRRAAICNDLARENARLRASGGGLGLPTARSAASSPGALPQPAPGREAAGGLVSVSTSGFGGGQNGGFAGHGGQFEVKMTSWPIVYDFQRLSMPKPEPDANASESPSMPCSVSRSTPTSGGHRLLSAWPLVALLAMTMGASPLPRPPQFPNPNSLLQSAQCWPGQEAQQSTNPPCRPSPMDGAKSGVAANAERGWFEVLA